LLIGCRPADRQGPDGLARYCLLAFALGVFAMTKEQRQQQRTDKRLAQLEELLRRGWVRVVVRRKDGGR